MTTLSKVHKSCPQVVSSIEAPQKTFKRNLKILRVTRRDIEIQEILVEMEKEQGLPTGSLTMLAERNYCP